MPIKNVGGAESSPASQPATCDHCHLPAENLNRLVRQDGAYGRGGKYVEFVCDDCLEEFEEDRRTSRHYDRYDDKSNGFGHRRW